VHNAVNILDDAIEIKFCVMQQSVRHFKTRGSTRLFGPFSGRRNARLSWLGGIGLAMACVAGNAIAHPHVWVSYAADIQMQDRAVASIAETWRFTNGFPVQIIGLDAQPKDGPATAAQTAVFKEQAFDSLGRVGYYTHLYVNGVPQRLDGPIDFRVAIEGGDVVYRFTLRLPSPVMVTGHTVTLGIWDPSFFVDYEAEGNAPDKAIRLRDASGKVVGGSEKAGCTVKSFADTAHPIFTGLVIPKAVTLSCA